MTMRMTMVALITLAAAAFAQDPPSGRGGRGRMGFDGPPGPGGPIESGAWILRGRPVLVQLVAQADQKMRLVLGQIPD